MDQWKASVIFSRKEGENETPYPPEETIARNENIANVNAKRRRKEASNIENQLIA